MDYGKETECIVCCILAWREICLLSGFSRHKETQGESEGEDMKHIVGTIVGVLLVLTVSVAGICVVSQRMEKGKYPVWDYKKSYREAGNYTEYDFPEVEVLLPAEWDGKYEMEFSEDRVDFYHSASHAAWKKRGGDTAEANGLLFSVCCSVDFALPDDRQGRFRILGSGSYGTYYLCSPEGNQGYMEDEEAWNEWCLLQSTDRWREVRLAEELRPKEQSGQNETPMDDFWSLEVTGGTLLGTVVSVKEGPELGSATVVIQTEEGETLKFGSCQWTYNIAGKEGDPVRVTYLGDLYGAPYIREIEIQPERDDFTGGLRTMEGIYITLEDDYLWFETDSGEHVLFWNYDSPRPETYEAGDRMRIEYLGNPDGKRRADLLYLVRMEKIASNPFYPDPYPSPF